MDTKKRFLKGLYLIPVVFIVLWYLNRLIRVESPYNPMEYLVILLSGGNNPILSLIFLVFWNIVISGLIGILIGIMFGKKEFDGSQKVPK